MPEAPQAQVAPTKQAGAKLNKDGLPAGKPLTEEEYRKYMVATKLANNNVKKGKK